MQQRKTEQYFFPTPEQPGDPTTYKPIQKRIFDELVELQTLEKLNPYDDERARKTFLENFDWSDTPLTLFERHNVEEPLVEFHDIFDDTGLKQIENSKSNSHQTMTDQHIAEILQPRSI